MQITGALDLEENPDKADFPNPRTCREIDKMKREIEDLQEKCKSAMPRMQGEIKRRSQHWKREWSHGSIGPGVESSKERSCKDSGNTASARFYQDELAAWAVHLQQQQQLTPRGTGDPQGSGGAVSRSHHNINCNGQ